MPRPMPISIAILVPAAMQQHHQEAASLLDLHICENSSYEYDTAARIHLLVRVPYSKVLMGGTTCCHAGGASLADILSHRSGGIKDPWRRCGSVVVLLTC